MCPKTKQHTEKLSRIILFRVCVCVLYCKKHCKPCSILTAGVAQAVPVRQSLGVIVQFRRTVKGHPPTLTALFSSHHPGLDPITAINQILGICRERRLEIKVQDPMWAESQHRSLALSYTLVPLVFMFLMSLALLHDCRGLKFKATEGNVR